MVFSVGTTSRRDRLMASAVATSSAHVASASARSDAALAASFLGLRRRGGDAVRAPSRMTRAPLLRLGGAYRDADLVADPEEPDAIRRGI
jgi:hypothetical protein